MRHLAHALVLAALAFAALVPAIAVAASPVEDFIAARDRYVADLAADAAAGKSDDALIKADDADRADLKARLEAILGPLAFAGFGAAPELSPETLLDGDVGSGRLDGLMFASEDWESRLIVTPLPVLEHWLAIRGGEEGAPAEFRSGASAALGTEELYTYSIGADAAFSRYVDLPVAAAKGEVVRAFLGLFAQDVTDDAMPRSLVVARIAGDRVVLATVPVTAEMPPIPACAAGWTEAMRAVEAARAASEKAPGDDALWEKASGLYVDANDAFRACFAREAAAQPFFAATTREAEALLGTIRGK